MTWQTILEAVTFSTTISITPSFRCRQQCNSDSVCKNCRTDGTDESGISEPCPAAGVLRLFLPANAAALSGKRLFVQLRMCPLLCCQSDSECSLQLLLRLFLSAHFLWKNCTRKFEKNAGFEKNAWRITFFAGKVFTFL